MQSRFGFNAINCWADFEGALAPLGKKAKGDAFEALTKWFFRLNEVHASQYDEVWLWAEVPERVKQSLNLPERDLGVDLLLRKGEEYHAVQCKYHTDRHSSVTFRQVSTFLSVLGRNDQITLGYICSSANGMSANLQKVTQNTKQIQRVLSDTWALLDAEFFDRVRSAIAGEKPVITPFKPRKHQKKAIAKAVKHFKGDNQARGKLIFPCGAGKSLTGYWIAEALKSRRTLIAVPSLSLVKQTIGVYLRECAATGRKVKWLCVCSDEGIGRGADVVMYHNDLGIPCETNIGVISQWLQDNAGEDIMVFTTYQSGRVIAEAAKANGVKFDLGLFDEAHKTVGAQGKLFSHLLFDENVDVERRVFMTATERFYKGSKEEIVSMDDGDVYGETFVQMTFKEAIDLDLLTDYKVITIEVQESEVADFIRDNNLIELNAKWGTEAEARSMASMLALRKAMKKFPIRNAVSFHGSIDKAKRSKELQKIITDSFNYAHIDIYTVSGKIPTTKRNDIVQEFAKSEGALITNARCLTEGIDVPNIDCIVFADPRRSKVDIVQALGRALRKKDGKDWGYVVLPVIYDQETGDIDNDNFEEILGVVRDLASNDERIIDSLKDQQRGSRRSRNRGGNQFELQVIAESLSEEQIEKALRIRLWDRLIRYDWRPFEEARKFAQSLRLGSWDEWRHWAATDERPGDIPSDPRSVYEGKGWTSFGDWLGTGNVAPKDMFTYLPFVVAREFARGLNLKSQKEWTAYAKSTQRPKNIPAKPGRTYKTEYKGIGDWLGTGFVATRDRVYRPFNEARNFARSLNLKTSKEWFAYCKTGNKPEDIPTAPNSTYRGKGWAGMGDWLGNDKVANHRRTFRPFEDARDYARSLKLTGKNDWTTWSASGKRPSDIPGNPSKVYKGKGWKGMADWLGTGNLHPSQKKALYCDFETAREYVRSKQFESSKDFERFCKTDEKPDFLPPWPAQTYKKDWKGWGDFLGNGKVATHLREYRPFHEARLFVHSIGLKNSDEWRLYSQSGERPDDIPAAPNQVYKDLGWSGMGDWLGTGNVAPKDMYDYLPFEEAREFVRGLKLKNQKEWKAFAKSSERPTNIPSNPRVTYKNQGWINLGDWLGTGSVASFNRQYRAFEDARAFARSLGLKSSAEWFAYCKSGNKPVDIPAAAHSTYRDKGWNGMGDWLGTGRASNRNRTYREFEEARDYARSLNLGGSNHWARWSASGERPQDIPGNPNTIYKGKGWAGWSDWLGTGNLHPSQKKALYCDFLTAREYVVAQGFRSVKEFERFCKSGQKPDFLAPFPYQTYQDEWRGWPYFLGKE